MSQSDSELPSAPSTSEETAPLTPDVMARILEPRVRSNAKNNAKVVKTSVVKTAPARESGADGEVAAVASGIESAPAKKSAPAPRAAPVPSENTAEIAQNLSEMRDLILALQENQLSRDRAFDLLYEELSGYKNDFYLERLKPTLRALLFLLDSIEGFDREIDGYAESNVQLTGELVKANLQHFCDQLTDILTLSEMTPIEQESDSFDPKTQRAIEVVKVEAEKNNTVQRQIRGGWRLGGKMLRAADVVVGRSE